MAIRIANSTDALTYNNVNVGDYIISGGGQAYYREDTGSISASAGQKCVILGGIYTSIDLYFGGTGGSAVSPYVITNDDGQVVVTGTFSIRGLKYAKITGKYDLANQTGNVNFQGHADGYAYSRHTYGISVQQGFLKTGSSGIDIGEDFQAINGSTGVEQGCSDIELEFVEVEGVGFACLQIKNDDINDANGGTMHNMKVHDCYLHDSIGGEGIYIGSTKTSADQSTVFLEFYNNRVIRTGVEGLQQGRLGQGSRIYNNILVLPALIWLNPFQNFQDKTVQFQQRNGDVVFEKNILIGGSENIFFWDSTGLTKVDEWSYFRNNYCGFLKNVFAYMHNSDHQYAKLRIEGNKIGHYNFQYDRKNNITEPNYYITAQNDQTPIEFIDNVKDKSKPLLSSSYLSNTNVTESGTLTQTIERPQFVDSGFDDTTVDWTKFEYWVNEIGEDTNVSVGDKDGQIAVYPVGWHVFHLGKCYVSIQESQGIEPGVTVGWESYWNQVTFDGDDLPADDFRNAPTTEYDVLGWGLLDTASATAASITTGHNWFPSFYGGLQDAYLYTPEGYDDNLDDYPLIVFFHGAGERGTNLSQLLGNGPPKYLWGDGNGVNGDKPEGVLVFMPQLPTASATWHDYDIQAAIDYVVTNYRINSNRIVLTGLSLGANGIFDYCNISANADTISGILPLSGARGGSWTPANYTHMAVYIHHGAGDTVVNFGNAVVIINDLNAQVMEMPPLLKDYNATHTTVVWDTGVYNIDVAGWDFYEWAKLQSLDKLERATLHVNYAESTSERNDYHLAKHLVDQLTASEEKTSLLFRLTELYSVINNNKKTYILDFGSIAPSGNVNQLSSMAAGSSISNIVDEDGGASTIGFEIIDRWSWADTRLVDSLRNNNNYFGLPDNVFRDGFELYRQYTNKQSKFTGLDNTKTYEIRIYGHKAELTAYRLNEIDPEITIGGVAIKKRMAWGNTNDIVFTNITPSFGEIVISMDGPTNSQDSSGISAMILIESSAVANTPPTVNVGSDQSITLPTNSANATATASDSDGTIAAYLWTKESGPTATLSGSTTANLSLSNLLEGTYVFRCTVTDNEGATAFDELIINVNPAAIAPTANAGNDQSITLPTDQVTLDGSLSSDGDGTIATYAWAKVSGGAATITSPSSASTTVTGLVEGSYVFRLTVTDNNGLTDTDDIGITINPIPGTPSPTSGVTFSTTEKPTWIDRYNNGYTRPTNMPDTRAATLARADSFVSNPSQDFIDFDPRVTPVDSYGEFLLSAAYEYLLTSSMTYGTPVKTHILNQVAEASVDYSTFTVLGTGSDNVSFSAAWVNKLFKAYDYSKTLFSEAEVTTIQTWFYNAALFFQRSLNERVYLGNIPLRSEKFRYDDTAALIAAQASHFQGIKCWVKSTNLYYDLTSNGTKTGSINDYTTSSTAYRKYAPDNTYVDRVAMQADQGNQVIGGIYYPQDISANFCYIWTGQSNGLLSDYVGSQRYLDQVAASGTLTGTYTHKTAAGVDTNNIPNFSDLYKNPMSMMAYACALIGHELDDGTMKDHARLWVEEYLKFGAFPDGTVAEYRRNGDPRPQQGAHFYGTICLEACINIADLFYRNSDSSLYQFTTAFGLHGTEGGSKNIRLLIETQIENITQEVVRYYNSVVADNELDAYYVTGSYRYLPELIFGLANKYYNEDRIKTTYLNTISGSRPYAVSGDSYPEGSGGHAWGGPMGYCPDITMTYELEPVVAEIKRGIRSMLMV